MDRTRYIPNSTRLHENDFPILDIEDQRKTDQPQAWNAGCSFAWGHGLAEGHDPYPNLVASFFGLETSILSRPGSSIEWSADQILRSDIRKGDLVVWGITSINRFPWYHENHVHQINPGVLDEMKHTIPEEAFDHLVWMYDDKNRLRVAVASLFQVVNFCQKIGAHLIITAHFELSEDTFKEEFKKYLDKLDCYVNLYEDPMFLKNLVDPIKWRNKFRQYCDYGSVSLLASWMKKQGCHPGPNTHKIWADYICKFIINKGILNAT
jgi:hypothetical protein